MCTKNIFFLNGNLKKGKGIIQGTFPPCYNEPDYRKYEWKINVSYISFVNKTDVQLNELIFVSTNLIRDHKTNSLGEAEVWNPYILHLQFSGNLNSIYCGQNTLTLSSFSSSVVFFFTDVKNNKLFSQDVDINITIILERKLL